MVRSWNTRRFKGNFENLIKQGRLLKIEDKYFPFKLEALDCYTSISRVKGHLPLHIDRAQDQGSGALFYPFHEGMIWNFVLWTKGSPALMLGKQNPKILRLEPGMAIWLDITETYHGLTALPDKHPKELPEAVICQVSGHPAFLWESALNCVSEMEGVKNTDK